MLPLLANKCICEVQENKQIKIRNRKNQSWTSITLNCLNSVSVPLPIHSRWHMNRWKDSKQSEGIEYIVGMQKFNRVSKDHLHFQGLSRPWICSFQIQELSRTMGYPVYYTLITGYAAHLFMVLSPPHNLDTAARRFSVAAPRLWNSLPLNCRTAPSANTFKIRLNTFLFDLA